MLSEVTSCYTARELSIRYVFIERKRGDEEIFRVDSLSDSAYSHRNLKIDFRAFRLSFVRFLIPHPVMRQNLLRRFNNFTDRNGADYNIPNSSCFFT